MRIFNLLSVLIDLLLLRASPAALPYASVTLGLLIFIEFAFNTYSLSKLEGAHLSEVVLATSLSLIVLIGAIFLVLTQKKVQARLPKVLIAWFGTELLLTIFINVIFIILPQQMEAAKNLQIAFTVFFSIWNVLIKAHIIKCATDQKMLTAGITAFGIMLLSFLPVPLILTAYLQHLPTS